MSTVPECWHGDECPWHKRGRCLLKHCAPPPVELTGGEVPVEQQLRDLRRALQSLAAAVMWRDGVPMPQREHEQVVDASVPMTVHQPGDQARRVPADFCGGGDAVTGPSDSDGFKDCESPDQPEDQVSWDLAERVHRQSCRHTYGDAATGPSCSDVVEDRGNPDHPGDQAQQGCCRYACGDAVVPQIQTVLKTVTNLINQVTKPAELPQTQHIDKVVVDTPVVMQRQVPQIRVSDKSR